MIVRGHPPASALSVSNRRTHPRGDCDPRSAGPCSFWLRADQGVTLNGSDVSDWANQAGSGSYAQGTAANQPAFNTGGLGGHPYLTFDGSASRLTNSDDFADLCNSDREFTIFAVVDNWSRGTSAAYASTAAVFGILGDGSSGAYHGFPCFPSTGAPGSYMAASGNRFGVAPSTPSDGAAGVYAHWHDKAAQELRVWLDGVEGGAWATAGATPVMADSCLGHNGGSDAQSEYYTGDLYEFLVYSEPLTQGQIIGITRYLGSRYGISVA